MTEAIQQPVEFDASPETLYEMYMDSRKHSKATGQPAKLGSVPYVLVQPQIPQDELNDPAHFEENFRRLFGPP